MEERFASYFKEMEWARQHTFEGGRIQGGQPHEVVYTRVTYSCLTAEKYALLFQYTERIPRTDRFIVAGEYWLRDDLTVWQMPLANAETLSIRKAKKLNAKEATEILSIAKSNDLHPEWDELMGMAIAANS